MQTLKNIINHSIQIDLQRDQCPVIARTESDLETVKKQFAKLNRHLRGMALQKDQAIDPAIALKRSRHQRGLV
jgi:hypothetical protein